MYEMPFQAPENLILLGRCVAILSGMCSGLDPQFNIWESVSPYATKLIEVEGGGKWKLLLDEVLKVLKVLAALPVKTDALITRMEQGRLEVRTPSLTREVERLGRSPAQDGGGGGVCGVPAGRGAALCGRGRLHCGGVWGGGGTCAVVGGIREIEDSSN